MAIKKSQKSEVRSRKLKDKRILITAGPTWVPIDNVRVLSNIATGETGILLAERLQRIGAKVTLLLGPVQSCCISNKINPALSTRWSVVEARKGGIELIRFKFFNDLKDLIIRELKAKQYDIVIHSAAVSDYRPKTYYRHKVESSKKLWRLNLAPLPKLIGAIKKLDRSILLVGFKFEPQVSKSRLINKARILMRSSEADSVAANTIYNGRYNAYIVSRKKVSGLIRSKKELVKILIREIGDYLCQNTN